MAPRKTIARARDLRRSMTLPEIALWAILRDRPDGFRFRRQHPLGPYVLDFYCPAAKLAIEIDGAAHNMGTNPQRDTARDAWLAGQGVDTLRIPAIDVLQRPTDALIAILQRCAFPLHRPADGPPPHAVHGED